jgi:hypothetical protein
MAAADMFEIQVNARKWAVFELPKNKWGVDNFHGMPLI